MRPSVRFAHVLVPLIAACFIPSSLPAGSSWDNLQPGPNAVGFRLLEERDPSRSIQVDHTGTSVQPRPLRIHVWYPANPAEEARPMTFGRYAEMATDDVWPDDVLGNVRQRTAYDQRALAQSLAPDSFAALLEQPGHAFEDAPAADGSFPLIVVGQGLYYESPITHATLCELLASRGFVVATVPLAGTHSPLVQLDVIDLETQVRDMEFAIARVRGTPFVDGDGLGLFGFDMGGMAVLILAMRNPDVDALASVDSAVLFGDSPLIPSNIPMSAPHHAPSLLRAPWFHATQRQHGVLPEGHAGPFLLDTAVHSDRTLVLVDGVGHADFTSYALIEGRNPVMGYWGPPQEGAAQAHVAVVRYVAAFFGAHLAGDAESRAFLKRDPEENVPGVSLTIEHRSAIPPRPVYADFLNALLAGDTTRAIEVSRSIREHRPDSPLFQEVLLNRLGYHLLFAWGLDVEALEVLKLNADLHPDSASVHENLGQFHMIRKDNERAILDYRKVLELDPDNDRARRVLAWLESQAGDAEEQAESGE